MKPVLVLCLGNDVLSDDSFGFRVGEALAKTHITEHADIEIAPVAGFALLDLLNGRRAVLIVDTIICSGAQPGTLHFFPQGESTPSRALVSSHQISLPTALSFGATLGCAMPKSIDILAVEASDVQTLSETMTPKVAAAVPRATAMILDWVKGQTVGGLQDRRTTPPSAVA